MRKGTKIFLISMILLLLAGAGVWYFCIREPAAQSASAGSGLHLRPNPLPRPTEKPDPDNDAPGGDDAPGDTDSVVHMADFQDVWRGDTAFADMPQERYDMDRFRELAEPLYRIAEQGGTREEFEDADYLFWDEFNYITMLSSLSELRSDLDTTDRAAAADALYSEELYYEAYEIYWAAMHAVAVSDASELMEAEYADWQIEWFRSYDPDDQPDRSLYSREAELEQEYYRLIAEDYPDWDAIGAVYVQLVELRREQARQSGYDNYCDMAYDSSYARDYTPEDVQTLWGYVKEYFVPLTVRWAEPVGEAAAELRDSGRIDCSPEAVLDVVERVVRRMSPQLGDAFDYMVRYGLYDISTDPLKRTGGYTTLLYYYNEPFLYNCPSEEFYDYTDTFHEFGHFTNYFYTQSDLVFGYPDNDLAELQSQGLELLSTLYFPEYFGAEDAAVMQDSLLMYILYSVTDGAMYDEFQQRVYAEAELTPERVNEIFAELYVEYGYEPYAGYEHEWMLIEHNFTYPFYYISYGISAIPALELFALGCEDPDAAVEKYLDVEAMDSETLYFSEALEEAGFPDVFDEETYRSVAVRAEACFAA